MSKPVYRVTVTVETLDGSSGAVHLAALSQERGDLGLPWLEEPVRIARFIMPEQGVRAMSCLVDDIREQVVKAMTAPEALPK